MSFDPALSSWIVENYCRVKYFKALIVSAFVMLTQRTRYQHPDRQPRIPSYTFYINLGKRSSFFKDRASSLLFIYSVSG